MAKFKLPKELADLAKKPSKYRNRKVRLEDGTVFDSQREYKRWRELQVMEHVGTIINLCRQVQFPFVVTVCAGPPTGGLIHKEKAAYVADFTYYVGGKFVVEDAKGFRTKEYRQRKRWMKSVHSIDIIEV